MRKISSESSPCKWEVMLGVSLPVFLVASRLLATVSKLSQERTSCWTKSTVIFTLVPPTWGLVWELPYTWICPDTLRREQRLWQRDVRNFTYSQEEPGENPVVRQVLLTISPTSTDWDTPRLNWSKRLLAESMFC